MIRIEKPLPGELEGTLDPGDYGLGVVREEPPPDDVAAERVRVLYAQTKKRTGVTIPTLEHYLQAMSAEQQDT